MLSAPILRLGATTITFEAALLIAFGLWLLLLMATVGAWWRSARARTAAARLGAEERVDAILGAQAEMQGRLAALAEVFGSRQAELTRSIGERLDGMSSRLGHSIGEQTKATHENLSKLQERLAVIDSAQNNIQSLAGQVVELQAILANKQTRGAFGQSRMEAIVADGLPKGAYVFQATLSNGSRPDCVVKMPNNAPSLVIDAKFPLESWNAMRDAAASGDAAETERAAAQSFRRDVEVHIRDIAEKYLLPGETQDTAFLFVPSESIFADIHENFEGLVQRAHRARVVIVSPSLLMLSIQVVQSVLKDARMREQAHLIQDEVVRLMEDVGRLDERVRKLQSHFAMTQRDVEQVLTSTGRLTKRAEKIEALELGGERSDGRDQAVAAPQPDGTPGAAASKTGQLRLRVIEDE